MLLSEIKTVIGDLATVDCRTDENLDIRHLLIDSRQLGADPKHTLFFAFKTEKDDGARYIPELAAKGVCAFVTGRSLEALQALAVYKRSLYHGIVIGITGSNGKTVVKDWLYELLKDDYDVIRSPKSYNSQIGVALSIWNLPDGHPTVIRRSKHISSISVGYLRGRYFLSGRDGTLGENDSSHIRGHYLYWGRARRELHFYGAETCRENETLCTL